MSLSSLSRRLAPVVAITALMGLAACATPSRPEAMILTATDGLVAAPGDVGYHSVRSVTAVGGSETDPMWASQVSNEALQTAVQESLAAAGYIGEEGRPLTVQVALMGLDQPAMGFDMTVTSRVRYTVSRDGQAIFNETIQASGTAKMGDAFAGVERLRMANEKSIQENIKAFLTRFRAGAR
ncbi:MAG: hypothetical protein REJ23_08715 [Brevundimonas sp.]|nr:hypothetical protein [Brevundimonas sp.]